MNDQIVWTWCPVCGERQDHVRNADGTLTCMECGSCMECGRTLPQDCAEEPISHSKAREPSGGGG